MNLLKYSITFSIVFCFIVCSNSIKFKKPFATIGTTVPTATGTPPSSTTPATVTAKTIPPSVIQTGIGCGTKYMKSRDVVRIQSNNFDQVSPYPPNDGCTWKFISKVCTLSVQCPCFDVPPTFECLGDYLKILDLPYYHQRFCGTTQPQGIYRASTELFALRFRSDRSDSGRGFVCFVQCTAPGDPDLLTPPATEICPLFPTLQG